jgi:hypothetical protein
MLIKLVVCPAQAVYTLGPLLIQMSPGPTLYRLGGNVVPEGEPAKWCHVVKGTTNLIYDHFMLVVGYTGPTPDSPNGSFILKNSWGADWAEEGEC